MTITTRKQVCYHITIMCRGNGSEACRSPGLTLSLFSFFFSCSCRLLLSDIWSLGITAFELAIGEPPHSRLHSIQAAMKIPSLPPPTLPDPHLFSDDFHEFMRLALIKDFHVRPSAEELLKCAFIRNAPGSEILVENAKTVMAELESKHESFEESQVLMSPLATKKGGRDARRGCQEQPCGMSPTHERQLRDSRLNTMRTINDTILRAGINSSNGMMIQGGEEGKGGLRAAARPLLTQLVDAAALSSLLAFHPPYAAAAAAAVAAVVSSTRK
jgi:serine/threonine protein kinase